MEKKSYNKYFVMCIILLIVSIGSFIWIAGRSIDEAGTRPKGGTVEVVGSGQVALEDSGRWSIFYELPSSFSDSDIDLAENLMIEIIDQSNDSPIRLEELIIPESYLSDGVKGVAYWEIEIKAPTTVMVYTYYEDEIGPDFTINITRDATKTILIGIALGLVISVLIIILGIILLVIGVVKRSNYKRMMYE